MLRNAQYVEKMVQLSRGLQIVLGRDLDSLSSDLV